jgi:hypothetical protein
MIDIPIGKAIVPVEVSLYGKGCSDCIFDSSCHGAIACAMSSRKDRKNVIFKLVDYPEIMERHNCTVTDPNGCHAYNSGECMNAFTCKDKL